jgi:hypothetical protein
MIANELTPMSAAISALVEYSLDSTDGGTRLTKKIANPTGPIIGRTLMRLLTPVFGRIGKQNMEAFARQIENDFRAHVGTLESEPEFSGDQIREAAVAGLQASAGNQHTSGGTVE